MEATFNYGDPLMVDYTPGSAKTGGSVIVIADGAYIAHRDIAANEKGALAAGGGIYTVTADGALAEGVEVYWNDSTNKVSATATGNSKFGIVAPGQSTSGDGETLRVIHLPGKLLSDVTVVRADITQETGVYKIPLTSVRVHDAMITNLPGTAANDDMALITGTPGTDAPTLQGVDFGGTSTDEKGAFEFVLPPEYVADGSVVVRVRGAMLTTVSDGTATVDVECWEADGDGGVSADLCATAAQSINSLTPGNKDFTITDTNLAPGDRLIIRLAFAGSDTGNLGVMIPEISNVELRIAIKG